MPAKGVCLACQHPERGAIDAAIAAGDGVRVLAKRFGISKSALHRHKGHLFAAIGAAVPNAAEVVWDDFLHRMREQCERADSLYAVAVDVMRKARRRRDNATALQAMAAARAALAEVRASLELSAKLGGQLKPGGTTVNVAVLGPESGGQLMAKLSSLIEGVQRRLPAETEEAPPIETTAELVTAEQTA